MKNKKGKLILAALMMLVSIALIMITTYDIIPIKLADTALTLLGAVLFLLGTIQFFFAIRNKNKKQNKA
ncbi:MAG: hypothetical protein IKG82_04625 [Oscillospiraceae bacterium]|nr:hypothetical protein [Oscillospiraceae bacterium]